MVNSQYPDSQGTIIYEYDDANRLDTVTDWNNGQFGYNYDEANRLTGLSLPNASTYRYDEAGRLTLLTHTTLTDTLASYAYDLDNTGNRRTLTETIAAIQPLADGAYLEDNGLVVLEAEHFAERVNGESHNWLLKTSQAGYTGTSYLQTSPTAGVLYQTNEITASPVVSYPIEFTTPGTYTVWVRGYASHAADDSLYVGLDNEVVEVTGFGPGQWAWANGGPATLPITDTGLYTLSLLMREDGLRIDRVLLTTDTTYLPTGFGLAETLRITGTTGLPLTVDRVIGYDYDQLYRLTEADYSTGELYEYEYDPVGNRLKQIIDGDTTDYLYDAANRLTSVDGQGYTFDDNGNLLTTGTMTNTFDAANRLTQAKRTSTILEPIYNGVNDRVGQVKDGITTTFALDVIGLPEVIYTSDDEAYLHLPGVIMTENASGKIRYLLSDGLGSIRQATDDTGQIVTYQEFDPYGNPVQNEGVYGYTGEWWQEQVKLLHLRARWYLPETGTFLSVDPVESEPPYQYVGGAPINRVDPSGFYGIDVHLELTRSLAWSEARRFGFGPFDVFRFGSYVGSADQHTLSMGFEIKERGRNIAKTLISQKERNYERPNQLYHRSALGRNNNSVVYPSE